MAELQMNSFRCCQGYVEEKKQLESDISPLETIVVEIKNKSGSSKTFIELDKKFTDIQ